MINDIRVSLSDVDLQLEWNDISQHPLELETTVSWLQLNSIQISINKPTEIILSGRVIRWSTNLDQLEQYALAVANHLKQFLLGNCLTDIYRIQISNIDVAYSGSVEDSDLTELESYTLSLTFNLIATLQN